MTPADSVRRHLDGALGAGQHALLAADRAAMVYTTVAARARATKWDVTHDVGPLSNDDTRAWLAAVPELRGRALLLWPSQREVVAELDASRFVERLQALWQPSAVDLWLCSTEPAGWLLELDHEEIFRFSRSALP